MFYKHLLCNCESGLKRHLKTFLTSVLYRFTMQPDVCRKALSFADELFTGPSLSHTAQWLVDNCIGYHIRSAISQT